MQVQGTQKVAGLGPDKVYRFLTDPQVLARCTPGVRRLEPLGEGPDQAYRVEVEVGVAAVRGRYEGTMAVTEADPPHGFVLRIEVSGPTGFVRAQVPIRLSEAEGGTLIAYDGEAQVGGTVAGVGQRVLGGVARFLVGQFFGALAREAGSRASGAQGGNNQ
jgi:carbon monoxide dehydrogenase subunit G